MGFVSHKAAGSVENARRNQPPCSGLELVGFGVVEDAVVSFIPPLQAAADVLLGGSRFEAEESVGKVVANAVELGWEIVRFGLPLLANQSGLLFGLVHVVGDGAHVVKELGINGPSFICVPNGGPNKL